tara:strand:- start:6197 stop:6856 length:660 start_codon:yes stop_codon:yes gene_type:complete
MAEEYGTRGGVLGQMWDQSWGSLLGGGGGGGGGAAPGTGVSRDLQNQAVDRLGGALGNARGAVMGSYDDAIRARQSAQAEAIRQMKMGIASPAAGTLVGSGAAGLLGSGAAQATARQGALTAGLERDRMLREGAEREAVILGQKASQQLGFAQEDLEAFSQRMRDHNDFIDKKRASNPLKKDMVAWLTGQRDSFPAGSPEWELYNNELVAQSSHIIFSG